MVSLSIFLFVTLLMLFLGGVVFVNDPKAKTNRLFLFWVLLIVGWMTTNYLENVEVFSQPVREFFLRSDFALGPAAQIFLMLFVINFVSAKVSFWKQLLSIVPIALASALAFTDLLLASVFVDGGAIGFEEGPAFPFYAIMAILYFVVPCIILFVHRRKASPAVRGQLTSISIGLLLTTIGTLGINLFLQNVLPVEWFRLGIYSMLFFEVGVFYSIVRHEFLRIQLIVVELLLLGILAMVLTRLIIADDIAEFYINLIAFLGLLVLGFALTRSVLVEIKQRKELEVLTEKLKAANAKLRELDALKTEFLSIASHQLRSPLAVMKGYMEMLGSGMLGKMTKKQTDAMKTVKSSTEQLILLVNHLLDLTRIESGRLQVRSEPVDAAQTVAWVVEFVRPRAQEKHVDIIFKPAKLPKVQADEDKLKEVVMNLIDNALKYTEKGSVTVTMRKEGSWVVIAVTDTGYGLTTGDKARLFEKFSTGSASKFVKTTSGLGLYVCKRLMEAMGGDISADSEGPGKGSTFTVRLPVAK